MLNVGGTNSVDAMCALCGVQVTGVGYDAPGAIIPSSGDITNSMYKLMEVSTGGNLLFCHDRHYYHNS